MNFTYTKDIPDPPHNPSTDVPDMKVNTNSIFNWAEVDHVGFNNASAGKHQFVQFPSNITPSAAPVLLASDMFTQPGTASAAASEIFFRNKDATFVLSAIKAFGVVNGVTGNLINGFNCTSAGAAGVYTITMTGGIVTGTGYAVIGTSSPRNGGGTGADRMIFTYSITSATQFQAVTVNEQAIATQAPASFSFVVLQI